MRQTAPRPRHARLVIGFSGKIGSGKDTACEAAGEELTARGRAFTVMRFAEPLRQIVEILTGVRAAYAATREGKTIPVLGGSMTCGEMQQRLGEGLRAILHADVWTEVLARRIDELPPDAVVLVPDVRFPNELALIRERYKGEVLRIDGDPLGVRRTEGAAGTRNLSAISETALDSLDWPMMRIRNDHNDLQEFKRRIHGIVTLLLGP